MLAGMGWLSRPTGKRFVILVWLPIAAELASIAIAWFLAYEDVPIGAGYLAMRILFACGAGMITATVGGGFRHALTTGWSAALFSALGLLKLLGVEGGGNRARSMLVFFGTPDMPAAAALFLLLAVVSGAVWCATAADRALQKRFRWYAAWAETRFESDDD